MPPIDAAERTENLTVILDCCHSATATRADDPTLTARQVDYNLPLANGALAPAAVAPPAPPGGAPTRSAATDSPPYVVLAACRADERAYELAVEAGAALWPEEQAMVGQTHGLFTRFLLRALRHGPAATYEDVIPPTCATA